ncbi:hypothetical protein JTE90_005098 [Oedothorax gibbosus]|uniref:Cyanocobalamin reductase (cyanide-eliminating) n=1 Tax=Oedothorax gibbosus TaxID=931172 RepID=A0AAV6VCT4_9ARAC|nr:hypothetical protein JTE90_005098 [Oedothorax gibbosus]
MTQVNSDILNEVSSELEQTFGSLGFEFHPFKVGWYNAFVQPAFKLNYDEDTVAFVILSLPKMFENAFVPFVQEKHKQLCSVKDPIDECMLHYLSDIYKMFAQFSVKVIHDFELHPNRRPKVIMQSAAHASGAAYFYNPNSVYLDFTNEKRKMYGVCIHPRYGGWFAIRAVAIFENLKCPNLKRTPPPNIVPSIEDQTKLLQLYNFSWKDWRFRDIIEAKEKYSDLQMKYFSTPPGYRLEVISEILNEYDHEIL